MPRPRKDVKKSKDEINRDHYKVMLEDKTYSEYLKEKKQQKQLKLTLSLDEDTAIRDFCAKEGIKPQEYILRLIRTDLGLPNGDINGRNTSSTEE